MASGLYDNPSLIIKMFRINFVVLSYLMSLFSVDSFENLGFHSVLVLLSSWMMLNTNQGRMIWKGRSHR